MNEVSKGLQTWFGYGAAVAGPVSAIILAILQNADAVASMPPWLYAILVGASPLLIAITGKNRSDQAIAKTHAAPFAAAPKAVPPLPPADGET